MENISGFGDWSVYWESRDHYDDEICFHHHRFETKKEAEKYAMEMALVKRGFWISVNYKGTEVSSFHQA